MTTSQKKASAEVLYAYFKKVVFLSKGLSFEDSKKVLLEALKDYLEGTISERDLAIVATELYYELNKPSDFNKNPRMNELGRALSSATEIDYYSKQRKKDPKMKDMYDAQMAALKEFYEKNKHELRSN
jgi:nucleoid-associated protein YejK